jgi:hypothetical protein
MMQFEILFGDGDGATRLIKVALTTAEVKAAAEHHHPDLCAQCYAMRRAYKMVPADWYHYSDRIKQIVLQ